ncbi:copper amine oxidase N-terminal domain-containing protein [Paenibacillus sp. TRM 82003]|nr:copper amine oxidase N-terminal domain-containing protein [Paenibacillus sp. TRM 82003]
MRKTWVVPLALAASLAVSGLAWAEGRYRTVEALMGSITFNVNGEHARYERDSIIYNGTIYVPVRSISEMLGASVGWDPDQRTVSLDFLTFQYGSVLDASHDVVYQYVAMENKKIVQSLTEHVRAGDVDGMRKDNEAWEKLEDIARDVGDPLMADYFAKMIAATEVLRTGWATKNFDDYLIAWALFESNAEALLDHLNERLGE